MAIPIKAVAMRTCANCKKSFATKVVVDGKVRNFQRRKYCLGCSPFGEHNTVRLHEGKSVVCRLCDRQSDGPRCGTCEVKIRRLRIKIAAVNLLGGKCGRCSWQGNPAGFQFHHLDPEQKDFTISQAMHSEWEYIKGEVLKCELLCANCHHIEHSTYGDERLLAEARGYSGSNGELASLLAA